MKSYFAAALLGATLLTAVPVMAQQVELTDEQLLGELDAHSQKWDEAFNANDAAAIAALYTEDAVEITNQGPIYGREALQDHYETLLKTFKFSEHAGARHRTYMITLDAETSTPVVLSHGEYSFTASDDKGNSMPLTGYWSAVSVREGGVWKDRMQTWNVAQEAGATETPESTPTQ